MLLSAAIGAILSTSAQGQSLFPVTVAGRCGYIDQTGLVVIPPQFQGCGRFSEGFATASVDAHGNHLNGYINVRGEVVIEPQFDAPLEFHEGVARFGVDQNRKLIPNPTRFGPPMIFITATDTWYKWGFIDHTGTCLIPPIYSDATDFAEGIAAVQVNREKWGFIDKRGALVIPSRFQWASLFSEGRACVMVDGKFGFIDHTGSIVIPPVYTGPSQFAEGLACVRRGGPAIDPREEFNPVPSEGEWQYVDRNGDTVLRLPDDIQQATAFRDGVAAIRRGDCWALIDRLGNRITDLVFDTEPVFSDGRAVVVAADGGRGTFEVINEAGKTVFRPDPAWGVVMDYYEGLAEFVDSPDVIGGRLGYIDKTGKVVWQPSR